MLLRIAWTTAALLLFAACDKASQTSRAPSIPLLGAPSEGDSALARQERDSRAVTLKGAGTVGSNATPVVTQAKKIFEIFALADNVSCLISAARQTGAFAAFFDGQSHTIAYDGTLIDKFIAKAVITTESNVISSAKIWVCDTQQATKTQTVFSRITNANGAVTITAKVHETNGFINYAQIAGTMLTTGLWSGNKGFTFARDAGSGEQYTVKGNQAQTVLRFSSLLLPDTLLASAVALAGNIYRTTAEASTKNSLNPPPQPLFGGYSLGFGAVKTGTGAFGSTLEFDDSLQNTTVVAGFEEIVTGLAEVTLAEHNAAIALATFNAAADETIDCDSLVAERTVESLMANLDSRAPAGSRLRGVDISGNVFAEAALNVCL